MTDAIDEVVDVVHRATDPRHKGKRQLFLATAFLLLGSNLGVQGYDTFFSSSGKSYTALTQSVTETKDSVAVLSGAFGKHLQDSSKMIETQRETNQATIEKLEDYMESMNYMDLKNSINREVDKLEVKINDANSDVRTLTIDLERADANGNINFELRAMYNRNLDSLKNQVRMWEGEIARKKLQLDLQ